MQESEYKELIEIALREDFDQKGDITSEALFTDEMCTASLFSKDEGIIAGLFIFDAVFKRIDPSTQISYVSKDGDSISMGTRIAEIKGHVKSVLGAERVALNFLCFLSGIATKTKMAVEQALKGGKALILDTRKTLPGYRTLSKYAVKIGGGSNHRMGLYDMILIKDNHIDAAGSLATAIAKVKKKWNTTYKIEVECRNLDEVQQAMENEVDIIMLDNMDRDMIKQVVNNNKREIPLEASGNMDLAAIKEVSSLGVDYISVGMLTHSVKALDFSLKIKFDKKNGTN
jgi:nicotinate-nucleotide pyrophosphorylase (carboxylating)